MTIAEEIIHDLKRLRIKANKDVKESHASSDVLQMFKTESFRNGLNMAIRVATQINNRRKKS